MKLLIATNNQGKLKEYQQILRELLPDLTLLTLREAGINQDVEETGETFEENARLKAVEYAALSGLPVIADDSGLAVEALGGFPGVHSARWAGPTDAERNREILAKLENVPEAERGAKFVCVALCRTPDGREAMAYGEVLGRIGYEPRGSNGFGYDPLFVFPERGTTMAELSSDEKNAISHRGRAARLLAPEVARLLGGIES
ncbi:MAG: RdgB/HAM1 family non-canonical purine NTP pyrophosphatase [Ardenticatenales bacterium]|nr:RdgB/HAM1 family non-canonical purine NTP pyrophosphatase [Ardenticatenales bacterium]